MVKGFRTNNCRKIVDCRRLFGKIAFKGVGTVKQILLHGLGQTAASWEKTISHMDQRLDIICPNLSDFLHGKEKSYINLYTSFAEYCKDLPEPLNLCGLSLGGIIALHYGIENPSKVNSLVLIGTQFTMPQGLLKFQNVIFRFLPKRLFKSIGFEKGDMINLTSSMMDLDFQPDLKTLTCPVLVVCGEKDRANKGASLQLKAQIPQAEIVLIEKAGHEVNRDAPEILGRVLNDFYLKVAQTTGE